MAYRRRMFFTNDQKAEIWDLWQGGESMSALARLFDRETSSIYPLLARTGATRPPERIRSRLASTLADRQEISRGLSASASLRTRPLNERPRKTLHSETPAERFTACVASTRRDRRTKRAFAANPRTAACENSSIFGGASVVMLD